MLQQVERERKENSLLCLDIPYSPAASVLAKLVFVTTAYLPLELL